VQLLFDIFQGIGIAAAAGIRPFLPGLAAGLLAAGNVEIHFDHTQFHFLQAAPFLLVVAVLALALIGLEASRRGASVDASPTGWVLAACGAAMGALFFGASLCRDHHPSWPGFVGGVICAVIAVLAARPFLTRLRSRLDAEAAALGVPLIAEGAALLLAILSVVAPPVGVLALIALIVLIVRGRGREDQKYAGLRILR
jgi:CDP-diglyceride synthetase